MSLGPLYPPSSSQSEVASYPEYRSLDAYCKRLEKKLEIALEVARTRQQQLEARERGLQRVIDDLTSENWELKTQVKDLKDEIARFSNLTIMVSSSRTTSNENHPEPEDISGLSSTSSWLTNSPSRFPYRKLASTREDGKVSKTSSTMSSISSSRPSSQASSPILGSIIDSGVKVHTLQLPKVISNVEGTPRRVEDNIKKWKDRARKALKDNQLNVAIKNCKFVLSHSKDPETSEMLQIAIDKQKGETIQQAVHN